MLGLRPARRLEVPQRSQLQDGLARDALVGVHDQLVLLDHAHHVRHGALRVGAPPLRLGAVVAHARDDERPGDRQRQRDAARVGAERGTGVALDAVQRLAAVHELGGGRRHLEVAVAQRDVAVAEDEPAALLVHDPRVERLDEPWAQLGERAPGAPGHGERLGGGAVQRHAQDLQLLGALAWTHGRIGDHRQGVLLERGPALGGVRSRALVHHEHRRHGERGLLLLAPHRDVVLLHAEVGGSDHALARDVAFAVAQALERALARGQDRGRREQHHDHGQARGVMAPAERPGPIRQCRTGTRKVGSRHGGRPERRSRVSSRGPSLLRASGARRAAAVRPCARPPARSRSAGSAPAGRAWGRSRRRSCPPRARDTRRTRG